MMLINYLKKIRVGVRQRVVLTLFGGLLISLTISSWMILHEQKSNLEHEVNRQGNHIIEIISLSLSDKVVGYDYHGIQLFIDEVAAGTEVKFVKVLSAKGNTMAETLIPEEQLLALKYFSGYISVNGELVGRVIVGINIEKLTERLELQEANIINRELAIILFIIIIEYFALSWLIVNPLSKISNVLQNKVSEDGVLTSDIEIKSYDEFGDIARQFNDMRDKLNKAHFALQGKFKSADEQLKKANSELIKKSKLLEETNKELQQQAVKDPLSGVYNRRKFHELMENEIKKDIERKSDFFIAVIDIDNFKLINDSYGHTCGDGVIKVVAQRIANSIRKNDILCRIGGEEYFVYLQNADISMAQSFGEKIREAIASTVIHIAGQKIPVAVSIGIAIPEYSLNETPERLYSNADKALYFSKENGKNQVSIYNDCITDYEDKTELLDGI